MSQLPRTKQSLYLAILEQLEADGHREEAASLRTKLSTSDKKRDAKRSAPSGVDVATSGRLQETGAAALHTAWDLAVAGGSRGRSRTNGVWQEMNVRPLPALQPNEPYCCWDRERVVEDPPNAAERVSPTAPKTASHDKARTAVGRPVAPPRGDDTENDDSSSDDRAVNLTAAASRKAAIEANSGAAAPSAQQVAVPPSAQHTGHQSDRVRELGRMSKPAPIPTVSATQGTLSSSPTRCLATIHSAFGYECLAAGDADGSVRVMSFTEMNPLQLSLYAHQKSVTTLSFHPHSPTLFTGSVDRSVKAWPLQSAQGRGVASLATITDTCPITASVVHPSGDFLLYGTTHNALRWVDLQTLQLFRSAADRTNSRGVPPFQCQGISSATTSAAGEIIVTGSSDSSVLFWDGRCGEPVNYIAGAHGGAAVSSVQIFRTQKQIMTGGLDGYARIWDLRMGKQMLSFGGSGTTSGQTTEFQALGTFPLAMTDDEAYTMMDGAIFETLTGRLVYSQGALMIPGRKILACSRYSQPGEFSPYLALATLDKKTHGSEYRVWLAEITAPDL